LEIFKNAFATIVSILAIYRFFYVARYAKKDGKMRVLRTLLITAAFLLTVGGVATVVLISFWGVALLFVGGVCLFIDGRLAKFDLDPQEQTIVDKFMARDVETRNLILQAVESNRRVVVRDRILQNQQQHAIRRALR
jgi:fatty acid desaturase